MTINLTPLDLQLDQLVTLYGLENVLAGLCDVCSFRSDIAQSDEAPSQMRKWEKQNGHIMTALSLIRKENSR